MKREAVPWLLTFILIIRTIIKLVAMVAATAFLGSAAAWFIVRNLLGIASIWLSYYLYKKYKERRKLWEDQFHNTLF